tara:strand:+ start:767 stop:937 length:171 start_codon:yes stop_codon:yes gene_type:complete
VNVEQLIKEAVSNSETEMEAKHTFRKMQWKQNRGTHMGHFEKIKLLWEQTKKGGAE